MGQHIISKRGGKTNGYNLLWPLGLYGCDGCTDLYRSIGRPPADRWLSIRRARTERRAQSGEYAPLKAKCLVCGHLAKRHYIDGLRCCPTCNNLWITQTKAKKRWLFTIEQLVVWRRLYLQLIVNKSAADALSISHWNADTKKARVSKAMKEGKISCKPYGDEEGPDWSTTCRKAKSAKKAFSKPNEDGKDGEDAEDGAELD